MCKQRVSGSLSLPSRGSFHRSFTVLFSIGRQVVFRLGGWSPRLQTGFLVSRLTLDTAAQLKLSRTGLSPSSAGFPKTVPLVFVDRTMQSATPGENPNTVIAKTLRVPPSNSHKELCPLTLS